METKPMQPTPSSGSTDLSAPVLPERSLYCELPADIIGNMVTPNANDPEAVAEYLAAPIRAVGEALDDGVSFADGKLADLPHDKHVWATLVRYRARIVLGAAERDGWDLGRTLPNSGIEVVRSAFVIRALKSQRGAPPAPGRNTARKQYWEQMQQLRLDVGAADPATGANLILDWDVTAERAVVLALSKPKKVWDYLAEPEIEWRHVIELDPSEGLKFVGQDGDVPVGSHFDLSELESEGEG